MAANRIKGITIEIGGDTTKLEKALSGVNKDLRATQSALRDVDKLLKLDPKSTELLTQKQDYLKKAVEDTKKKLDTEKEALAQLNANNKTGETTEEQKALEREIIATEQSLKKAEKAYNDFGSVGIAQAKAVGSEMQEVGGKITAVGGNITKGVTVPIAAAAGASVAAWKEVDAGLDIVTKKTGATGEALEGLKDRAKNLAKEIPTDFETAGAAVGEVNTKFGLTGDALEDLSGKFIKFAKLNEKDVASSVDEVQKALSAYGLEADKAGAFLDRLNTVAQETGADVSKLATGIVSNATAFRDMGLDIDQATYFMGELERSGVNSETVLNGMRKALKSATKEGKPLSVALEELQETIRNGKGDVDGLTAAYEMFGKSGDQIYGAVRDGTIDFSNLAHAISDAGGSVDETFENTLSPLEKMQTTLNELKLLGADIIETAAPALETALQSVGNVVRELSEKWNSLTEDQQQGIIKAALVVAALGPVVTAVGGVVTAIGTMITAAATIGPAVAATIIPAAGAAAAAAAPFLAGGVVVAGLIGTVAYVVNHWEWFKQKATDLKNYVVQRWNELKAGVETTTENLKNSIVSKWETAKANVSAKVAEIKTQVLQTWDNIKTGVSDRVEAIKSSITDKFTAAKTAVLGVFDDIKEGIKDKIDGAKSVVDSAIEKIKGAFDFSWSLPDLKLPHIHVGSYIDVPVLGTIPDPSSIYIDWYKKAYDNPVMFTRPTVLQTPYGLKGFGDGNGGEVVLSEAKLRALVGSGGGNVYNLNIYPSPGMDVNALADAVQDRLVDLQRQREAAGIA